MHGALDDLPQDLSTPPWYGYGGTHGLSQAAAGRPKTPQQAWEAHMKLMGGMAPATEGSNSAVIPPGDPSNARPASSTDPKPMLAAKLAKDMA
mmetsp:Transcript_9526/g.14955  ORF Transcript_9526/g.14955 Transcript_9526/m.14955 type:complete len:93 (-) Transcript_9526:140-418(-)